MSDSPQWKGTCAFCDGTYAKGGMVQHLRACSDRDDAFATANGQPNTFYHLRVDDEWAPPFWLDLEMRGSAPMGELDSYLRSIWLECCGHMSQFTVGGFGGREISDSQQADAVLDTDTELTHLYDFGTTSKTRIRVMDVREGAPATEHPITLMARNEMPEIPCKECDRQATQLCTECMYERDQTAEFCDEHTETHSHSGHAQTLPLVNSPRTGMCGYTGPAEPPY